MFIKQQNISSGFIASLLFNLLMILLLLLIGTISGNVYFFHISSISLNSINIFFINRTLKLKSFVPIISSHN